MKNPLFFPPAFILGIIFSSIFAPKISASEPDSEFSTGFTNFPTQTKSQLEELKPNAIYARQLNGNENHLFTVRAEAGRCLRFVIEQKGIDVTISVNDKENLLKKVDRPSGAFGRETVTFIVPQTGIYKIEIKAWLPDAIVGNYEITYTVAESPVETDRKRSLAEDLTSEAEVLRAENSRGSKEKALRKFAEALTVWQQLDDLYEQAVVFYGIGYTHYNLSNHYEAAFNYNRALRLHLQIGNEAGQAVNRAALGAVQYTLNENEFAVYNFQKAVEIYKKFGNVRGLGIAFQGLGTTEFQLRNFNKAFASFNESLKWRSLANDRNGKVRTHIMLGKVYLFLKIFDRAEQQLLEAQKSFGSERAKKDTDLNYYFGRYFLLTGNFARAKTYFEEALILSRQAGDRLGEAQILLELSRCEAETKQFQKALEQIKTALDLIENVRQKTLDYHARINFFTVVQPFYEHYVSLLMRMHEEKPEKAYHRQALEISEQSRARGLLDQIERRRQIKQGKIQPELLEREQRLRNEFTEVLARTKTETTAQTAAKTQEIASQFIEVEWEINRWLRSPETVSLPTLTIEKIQGFLDEKTVLLEYAIIEREVFLWFVSKSEIKSFRLAPAEKIENEARAVYKCISEPETVKVKKTCRQKINSLSEDLLRPVARDLAGRRLLIVKQGFLHYIPFDVLFHPFNQDNYLIETNEIVTLPSASVLSFIQQPKQEEAPQKILAVFSDPIFSAADGRLSNGNLPAGKFSVNENLPRLFASKFEAERISASVPVDKLLIKTDAAASRDAIFEANLKDYRIIHFATHTLIDDRQPELSAIVLSMFDKNGNSINGFLRRNDILRIDLNADLAVLSSCRSGIGKQIEGEGMLSLANSFFAAGARRLLVSIWDVNDKVTAELMSRFYRKHLTEKRNISDALREAKLEIMQDRRWKSPYYWAAFTLNSD